MSYSYAGGRRSRQVGKTGQYLLDADEIAHLKEDETIVLVDGLRPLVGRKLRYYKDRDFKRRLHPAVPLPEPLAMALPDTPRVAVAGAGEGTPAGIERIGAPAMTSGELQGAIEAIEGPEGLPTEAELQRMARELAEIALHAPPEALAGLPG